MAVSDAVISNQTTIYVAVVALIKAYGLILGRSFGIGFILVASTAWDVSQKATQAISRDSRHEMCKGGICWHGVVDKSPASQVRFQLPQQQLTVAL